MHSTDHTEHPKAELRRLREENAILRARLAAQGIERLDAPAPWASGLARGPITLLAVLLEVYPKVVDRYQLEALLPSRDHVVDRDVRIVNTYVNTLRERLGKDVIKNFYGHGYRCGDEFYDRYGAPRRAA